MGQNWASPQQVFRNMSNNEEFLKEERDANLNPYKCPHLRHLTEFKFYEETIQGEQQYKIQFECQPNFTTLKNLEQLNIENQLNSNHFQDIFQQLIEGLYEMHKNNFFGRCISLENIAYTISTKTLNYGSFGFFHSFDQLLFPPECLYKLVNTYEADYWLVAKLMWSLYTKKKEYYGKTIQDLAKDILLYRIKTQSVDENREPKQLVKLINSMLHTYCGKRISISSVLKQDFLKFNKREEMIQFYENYDFGSYFLRLMKSTQKRDSLKILVYEIDLKNPICKHYYKEIYQILLAYIVIQLSFHFPTKDDLIYPNLLSTLSLYLTISSKFLKDKLILQENGHQGDSENYSKLLEQIINSHNSAYKFEKHVVKQWKIDFLALKNLSDVEKKKIIHFKLYYFRSIAEKAESLPQKLLLNLLCNLNVKDRQPTADKVEEDFLNLLNNLQNNRQ